MARGEEGGDHTPAVVNGQVMRTSVSALTAFDPESYGGCPRRYYFTRVEGVKEEKTVAQDIGTQGHEQIEMYLPAGKGVLGPYAMAGKHLLPRPGGDISIEGCFGDIEEAVKLRKTFLASDNDAGVLNAMVKAAGLVAGEIPLDGYIDVRHARGEFVDASGLVQREAAKLGKVVEVIDHKFTSSIEKFAKGPSEMAATIQMVGYANYVLNVVPDVDHVRVSHIYYQTRGPKLAKKVTALLSESAVREGWGRVDELANYMEEVVRAKRVEDVEPQLKSCDAYRGCPHLARCPITRKFGSGGGNMSLFGNSGTSSGTNGTSAPPQSPTPAQPAQSLFGSLLGKPAEPAKEPPKEEKKSAGSLFGGGGGGGGGAAPSKEDDAAHRSAVDVEKKRLEAEERGQAAQMGNKMPVTACEIDKSYFVDCADGARPRLMKFSGSSKGFFFFVDAQNGRVKLEVADDVYEVLPGAGSAVIPSDAPRSSMPGAAVPLRPEQIEKLEDPEIKQRATEHAAQAAQQGTAGTAPAGEKSSGRCGKGGVPIVFTDDNLATQSYTCECGKVYKFKALNAAKEGNQWCGLLPAHNLPKAAAAPQAPAVQPTAAQTAQAPQAPASAPASAVQALQAPEVPSTMQSGIMLFIDVAVERGAKLTPLDEYYTPIVRQLEADHGAADIRCAPQDSALAYMKWKGALASMVRAQPPAPGIYTVRSASEIAQVVIEELAPLCTAVLRGLR